ncbi:MAG: M1 family metallopeptidase [Ginsengibacter sp.]
MKKIFPLLYFLFFISYASFAQPFTHADTLRGSNGPARAWWNVIKYDLHVNFFPNDSTISGYNEITYKVLSKNHVMQIDLQDPLILDSVMIRWSSSIITFSKNKHNQGWIKVDTIIQDGNSWFLKSPYLKYGTVLKAYYHGRPHIAVKPPWDGGVVWKKDKWGREWIAVACQGLGASVWYPCKDYQGDEPDNGASMTFTAPSDLITVSNGRLRNKTVNTDGTTTTTWAVVNPINNYDISPYIGKYVHFGEIYKGEKGNLTMDYWVLDSNLAKAKIQFKDAPRMMKAFEYWFGPYPFYEDGYKLVDAPYLGMEHQSAIGYGNGYTNGYAGRDLSHSGWGLKWDFIIVHESGHEWFGNNITTKDIADMWVHEGFTNYSETLFTEYYYGKEAGTDYIVGVRKNIKNDKPIIGNYGVNNEGSGDMYYKGGNMIHMIRQIINDDNKFRNILRGLNKDFYHQIVTGKQIEDYVNKKSGINFSKVFDQYLRTIQIPVLEYKNVDGQLYFRWSNCVDHFAMPLKVYNDKGKLVFIYPTPLFQKAPKCIREIKVDRNFYIGTKKM